MSPAFPGQKDHAVRQRLLEAALYLFTTKGYAATSVREIVAAAQVTKPVLYYYFLNKEGIYLELISCAARDLEEITNNSLQLTGNTRSRITRFCREIMAGGLRNPAVVWLMHSSTSGPPQGVPEVETPDIPGRIRQVVRNIVAEGVTDGELAAEQIDPLVRLIVGVITVSMEEQLAPVSPPDGGECLEQCLSLAFAGAERCRGQEV